MLKQYLKTVANGFDVVYTYDFDSDLLRKLGYHVVRAIAPKLLPLHLNEEKAFTVLPRLKEYRLHRTGNTEYTLNDVPHLFP